MEEQMQYIDDFFQGNLSKEDVKGFEERIINDPAFAAEVAFYLSSKESARKLVEEEKKKRYKEIYSSTNGYSHKGAKGKVRNLWYAAGAAMAAAILTAVVIGVFYFNSPSPREMANRYLAKNYLELPVKMGAEDEMQKGLALYNNKEYVEALAQFENVILKDSSSFNAIKYAGLAALQVPEYDKALQYFRKLETFNSQFSNPAVLLQAVMLMKRNQPGDKPQAKLLLQQVVAKNLEGKEAAQQWLKKF